MKKRNIFISLIAGLMIAMMLVGCGAPKTLEGYMNTPGAQQELEKQLVSVKAMYASVFKDVDILFNDNTVTYVYTFKNAVSQDEWDSTYETSAKSDFEKAAPSGIDQQRQITNIKDPITFVFIYKSSDGTELAKYSLTK